ncbi:MAG: YigZ family protein [Oscillospiraceae bacterium]|nr:YigZ family protein [Oscillospiraceae bacterium]
MDYITLKKEASAEFVDRRSRFIARVSPVKTEEQAHDFLNAIRQDHSASHHVFAYRLRDRHFARYNDDGEPSGTAGLPVLDILERGDITDAIIVVSRWFGGTLLGTGGLVRAYSTAAKMAVEAAGVVEMGLAGIYTLNISYGDYDKVIRMARDTGVLIDDSQFSEEVLLRLIATDQVAAAFSDKLRELTRGSKEIILVNKEYYPLKEKKVF